MKIANFYVAMIHDGKVVLSPGLLTAAMAEAFRDGALITGAHMSPTILAAVEVTTCGMCKSEKYAVPLDGNWHRCPSCGAL